MYYDFCAYNMRIGKTAEGHRAFRQGVVNQMRELKQGRFHSENQRRCGFQNKGIMKQPHAKNEYVLAAFQKGMFWISSTGEEIIIPPGSIKGVGQLTDKLLFAFSEKQKIDYAARGSRSYAYVGLNKILSGWRDKKTNKCMFCVGPWRLGVPLVLFFLFFVEFATNLSACSTCSETFIFFSNNKYLFFFEKRYLVLRTFFFKEM